VFFLLLKLLSTHVFTSIMPFLAWIGGLLRDSLLIVTYCAIPTWWGTESICCEPMSGVSTCDVAWNRSFFLQLVGLTRLHGFLKGRVLLSQIVNCLVFHIERVLEVWNHPLFGFLQTIQLGFMLLFFLVKFEGSLLVNSLDWLNIVLFVVWSLFPHILFMVVRALKHILRVHQVVLSMFSDGTLILESLLLDFLSWRLAVIYMACASIVDAISSLLPTHVVQFVLVETVVLHHVLVISFVVKVLLTPSCKLVCQVAVFVS
jgi:hypothetical protein